jgi:RNA polymerase sigma-70 factor (ECF subfamily)
VLHHLLDLPVEDVARETNSSSGAVRTRLSRARKLLGAQLAILDTYDEGVVANG